jgi:hypothetical protein
MRLTIFAATFAFLLWGAPAFAGSNPDLDLDGVGDVVDNCSETPNSTQDDTDGDLCGNLCDADYTQSGTVSFEDFGLFGQVFGLVSPNIKLTEPVSNAVAFADFGIFGQLFGTAPGPSGPTTGTLACP